MINEIAYSLDLDKSRSLGSGKGGGVDSFSSLSDSYTNDSSSS